MATVLTCYYRPKPGGFCKRLFRAIDALLADGHSVHYLAVQPFPIDHPRCHFHRFPWPKGATENLPFWAVLHLLAPIWILYIGLVQGITHAFAFQHTYALIMQPLRLFTGVPLTLFLRSDVIECHLIKGQRRWLSRVLAAIDRAFEGLALNKVRLIFCSHALREQVMSRRLGAQLASIIVLPNDIPKVELNPKRELASPIRLSFIGTLEPRKNPGIVLRAVAGLSDNTTTLSFFGVGPETERLEALARALGIKENVIFRGWVPAEHAWAETDLLLFPSVHEGSPNVVLEAIAHGVPVLAGDIPEMRELVPANNLLPIDDAKPWTEAIHNLLTAPQAQFETIVKEQAAFAAHLRFDWNAAICKQILNHTPPLSSGLANSVT